MVTLVVIHPSIHSSTHSAIYPILYCLIIIEVQGELGAKPSVIR